MTLFTYHAFVSYSHRDKAWGEWLHGALEGYRIDKNLVGRDTAGGPVPATLRPIFRDREDFSAGHSLTEQTRTALAASKFLVVVCSPHAAQSKYVNEEILCFKASGGDERVVAIIVDGEPGDSVCECFPPALRFKVLPDGVLTGEPEAPIAADARCQGDGKRLALLKVIAALLSLPLDDVRKREALADNRRIMIAAAGVLVVAVLGLFAAYLSIAHQRELSLEATRSEGYQELNRHSREILSALMQAGLVEEAAGTAVADIAKRAAAGDARQQHALDLLKTGKIEDATRVLQAFADDKMKQIAKDQARVKAESLEAATAYRNLGAIAALRDPRKALDAYEKAVELDPDDVESVLWSGMIRVIRGDLEGAQTRFYRVLSLANANDSPYHYWARLSLGQIRAERGDVGGALKSYRDSLALVERVATSAGGLGVEVTMEDGLVKVVAPMEGKPAAKAGIRANDVITHLDDEVVQGMTLAQAVEKMRGPVNTKVRLRIMRKGAEKPIEVAITRDVLNQHWQAILTMTHGLVGDMEIEQGDLASALKSYRDGLAIAELLATSDPGKSSFVPAVFYNKIGGVHMAQGDLAGALKSYGDGLAITERLAASDPGNVGFQGFLAESYNNIGGVHMTQGDLAGALKSYRDSRAIAERLATSDPGNASWQRALAASYIGLGGVQMAQGDVTGALKSYRDSLAIAERLAASDPGNVGFQGFLAESYNNIGGVQIAQGDVTGALKSYRDSRAIAERLAIIDPGNASWQRALAASYIGLGGVQMAQGDVTGALKSYRDSRAIAERLATSDPGNVGFQGFLAASHIGLGGMQISQGDVTGALKSYRDGLAIADRLATSDPGNVGFQGFLAGSYIGLGGVQIAQGDATGALKSYRDGLAIAERLATSHPGNVGFQGFLAESHIGVGGVHMAQGDLAGALKSYSDGLAIAERLAATDPGNVGFQGFLAESHIGLGGVQMAQGDVTGALKSYRDGLAIAERLATSYSDNAVFQSFLAASHIGVGDTQMAQGDVMGALKSYRDGLAIAERLATSHPSNVSWQSGLAESYTKTGDVKVAQGDLAGALKSYRDGLAIAERLATKGEAAETEREGKPGKESAHALVDVAMYAIFAREFTKALIVADRAHELLPDDLTIETNRAHALMFLGRGEESKALYFAYKGKSLQDSTSWERAIANDFTKFRKAGLTRPMMADLEQELGLSR
jgi:tetratricopeptide (TPR) repeat protein